jgi:ribonuclease J
LARIAEDGHPNIELEEGDLVVFSARTIPGNEKEVGAVINNLSALAVDVITADDALVHSSGHPRQGELRQMYQWLKPRALVPMHGEPRHLFAHATFAKACGIADTLVPEDGKIIRLAPGPLEIVDEISTGTLHVDGKLIVDGAEGPAKERRKLSFVGIIVVGVLVDARGDLVEDPQVMLDGVPRGLQEELEIAVEKAFESMPRPRRKNVSEVAETIRTATRRVAELAWGKKPIVKVLVSQV